MTLNDKRRLVSMQCEAVMTLANTLANVSRASAVLFNNGPGPWDDIVDQVGAQTAQQMEVLGNMLNGMDAVGPDAERLASVFSLAQLTWPKPGT